MSTAVIGTGLPTDEHYARNLVDGAWRFPAAPYEFEIRNPLDSTITTVVPLSSRFDVARAVAAATAAAPAWAADTDMRSALLSRLADALALHTPALARLQATETGLDQADSERATAAIVRLAQTLVQRAAGEPTTPTGGVTGHVLSWGLPLLEAVAALIPQLAAGRTVVVKPSLRAPQSAVALAHLATELGFPPGVVNVVQGTGEDVGAALCGTPDLALLHVRAGARTLAQASRATAVSGVALHALRGGGNVAIAGPDVHAAELAQALAAAIRVHSTGGPLGLPLLAVHTDAVDAVQAAVIDALHDIRTAPLPTETLRRRALAGVDALRQCDVLAGGALPDDIRHRMGWVTPPTVIASGRIAAPTEEPLGPVLRVHTWTDPRELARAFTHARYADGVASVWGLDDTDLAAAHLPHPVVLRDQVPAQVLDASDTARLADLIPATWISGATAAGKAPS